MKSFRTKLSLALALALSLSASAFADDAPRTAGQALDDATITATVKTQLLADARTDGFDINVDTTKGVVTLRGGADSEADKIAASSIASAVLGVTLVHNELVVAADGTAARTAANAATASGESRAVMKDAAADLAVASENAAEEVAAATENAAEEVAEGAAVVAAAAKEAGRDIAAATKNAADELEEEAEEAEDDIEDATAVAQHEIGKVAAKAEANAEEAVEDTGDAWLTTKVKTKLLAAPDVQGAAINVETRNGVVHLIGKMPTAAMKSRAIDLARTTEGVKSVEAGALTCCQ